MRRQEDKAVMTLYQELSFRRFDKSAAAPWA